MNSPAYLTLRTIALAVALVILAFAIFGALFDPGVWPFVGVVAVVCAALAFERRHYGTAQLEFPDQDWHETSEQFIDDASGELVRVWFNPATGERRYVATTGD